MVGASLRSIGGNGSNPDLKDTPAKGSRLHGLALSCGCCVIKATYTNRALGQTCDLEIPLLPGESWEDGLHRIAPVIRDAMGFKPVTTDPVRWAEILKKVSGK